MKLLKHFYGVDRIEVGNNGIIVYNTYSGEYNLFQVCPAPTYGVRVNGSVQNEIAFNVNHDTLRKLNGKINQIVLEGNTVNFLCEYNKIVDNVLPENDGVPKWEFENYKDGVSTRNIRWDTMIVKDAKHISVRIKDKRLEIYTTDRCSLSCIYIPIESDKTLDMVGLSLRVIPIIRDIRPIHIFIGEKTIAFRNDPYALQVYYTNNTMPSLNTWEKELNYDTKDLPEYPIAFGVEDIRKMLAKMQSHSIILTFTKDNITIDDEEGWNTTIYPSFYRYNLSSDGVFKVKFNRKYLLHALKFCDKFYIKSNNTAGVGIEDKGRYRFLVMPILMR